MQLVELAMKGVRGFPRDLATLAFAPGLNLFHAIDEALRASMLDLFFHTFYPDPARADATNVHAEPGAGDARIALTVRGRKGDVLRVVRDVFGGGGGLYHKDPHTDRFSTICRTGYEVVQYLRMQEGLPDDATFDRLYMLGPDSMPSRGAAARSRSGHGWTGTPVSYEPAAPGLPPPSIPPGSLTPIPPHAIWGSHPPPPLRFEPTPLPSLAPQELWTGNVLPALSSSTLNPVAPGSSAPPQPLSLRPQSTPPVSQPAPVQMSSTPAMTSVPASTLPIGSTGPVSVASPPIASAADWSPELTAEKRALHAQLECAVIQAKAATRLREELETLRSRKLTLSPLCKALERAKAELADRLSENAEADVELRAVPLELADRARGLEEAEARLDAELKRLIEERTGIEAEYASTTIVPLQNDKYFVTGTGIAIAAIGLAIVLDRPAVALVNLLSALVAMGAGLRYVGELEARARNRVRLEGFAEREARLQKQREVEIGEVKRVLDELTLSPADLIERLEARERRREALARARAAGEEAERMAGGPNALDEFTALERRIEEVEAEVDATPALESEEAIRALERRLERLANEIKNHGSFDDEGPTLVTRAVPKTPPVAQQGADDDDDGGGYGSGYGEGYGGMAPARSWNEERPPTESAGWSASGGWSPSGPPSAPPGGMGGGYGMSSAPPPSAYAFRPDRSRILMATGSAALQLPIETVARALQVRMAQYVGAFTDGVYSHIEFGPHGEVAVGPALGLPVFRYADLDPRAIDLVDAAIRLTLVEAAAAHVKAPVLIDDPFVHFEERRRGLFRQMLGYLAQATQVIVLSPIADLDAHAVTVEG